MKKTRTPKRPAIALAAEDHERLTGLATDALDTNAEVAEALLAELDRARIVSGRSLPRGTVRMGSTVVFRAGDAPERRVTLVYPAKADIAEGKISIMTPIGAALIGLSEGQEIDWTARDGKQHRLTVLSVSQHDDAAPASNVAAFPVRGAPAAAAAGDDAPGPAAA